MDLFDLSAKITLDTSEYERGLNDAGGKLSGFGSKLKAGLATAAKISTAAVGVAATGVSAIVKSAVDSYANYEQLIGGVETLFKNSASGVIANAEKAYQTAGLSMNKYMETVTSFSASLIQSLGGDTQAAAQYADMAITDMSDNANKMGTSMEAIQNAYQGFAKQNYTMLDNLKLGYGGTKTEMERLIQDAEKLDSSFKAQRDSNGDLTMSFADVVGAIHVVQENMGITGTTAKEASSTIQGSIASTKAAWENLLVALSSGEGLEDAISNVVESAKNVVNNIVPIVTTALTGVGEFVKDIGPVIVENLPALIENLLPSLIEAAVSLVGSLIAALPGILSALWAVLETLFTNNVMPIIGKAVKWGANLVDNIKSGIESAWGSAKTAGSDLIAKIGDGIIEKFNTVKAWGTGIVDGIKSGIIGAWGSLTSLLNEKIQSVKNFFAGVVSDLKNLFNFEFTIPHIPLPHFSWSWNDLGLIKIPNVSVEWYKKAYETPYMFSKPTVMGFGDGVGDEMVYGKNSLMEDIRNAVKDVIPQDAELPPILITVQSVLDGKVIGETSYKYIRGKERAFG